MIAIFILLGSFSEKASVTLHLWFRFQTKSMIAILAGFAVRKGFLMVPKGAMARRVLEKF